MKAYDLGIRCDYLLTMAKGKVEFLRDQFLGISGDQIKTIAPWKSVSKSKSESKDHKPSATRWIDLPNRLVMPGLINGHTHLPMSLFKGLADDLPFAQWLNDYIVPLEQKMVDPEFVRIGTELSAMELIRCGTTTVCDMYYYEDAVAETVNQMGLRGLVGETIADFPAPDDRNNTGARWKILERMRQAYKNSSRITPCYAPHAPYSCSDATLQHLRKVADQHPLPIIIHVSETLGEVQECLKNYGVTPVQRLSNLGILSDRTILAHCVHLSDRDIELIAKAKASVVYNPESNMKLGSGIAPIARLLDAGIHVGVGTDGSASNNDLNLFSEMDSGAKLQKVFQHQSSGITARQMLTLSTWGGAHALGLGDQVGSLEEGKKADITILGLQYPHLQPIHDLASQLVYSATGHEVETVICNGQILFENGRYTQIDPQSVYERVEKMRQLSERYLAESGV